MHANDAQISGIDQAHISQALAEALGPLPETISFTVGESHSGPYFESEETSTGLLNKLTTHMVGPKVGYCFVPGLFGKDENGQPIRTQEQALAVSALLLDRDDGTPMDEGKKAFERAGVAAALHTTRSHMTPLSDVSSADWKNWLAGHPDGTPERFLIEVKKMRPEVAKGAGIEREEDGKIFFRHQPCPRWRAVVIYSRAYVPPPGLTSSQKAADYRGRCEAATAYLGLNGCDPAVWGLQSLVYLARHEEGAPHDSCIIEGQALNIYAFDPLPSGNDKASRAQPEAPAAAADAASNRRTDDTMELSRLRGHLAYVSPADRNGVWLKVGFAIREATLHTPDGVTLDEADKLALWLDWCSGRLWEGTPEDRRLPEAAYYIGNYVEEDAVKLFSAKPSGTGKPVTLGSVVRLAEEHAKAQGLTLPAELRRSRQPQDPSTLFSSTTAGAAAPQGNGTWRAGLQQTANGVPKPTLTNAVHVLKHAPECQGVLAYDEFADRIEVRQSPPWHPRGAPFTPRHLQDHDATAAAAEWLGHYLVGVSAAMTRDAMVHVGRANVYDPVKDYLSSVEWDGTPRLDRLLPDHFGTEDSDYTRAVGSKFLISAVARVFQPGCKVDTVLILEGVQGLGKSSAIQTIFGAERFIDHMPDLTSKEAQIQLRGKWCVEFAELNKLSRTEVNTVKAFITQAVDCFRTPYGRETVDVPRRCVFAGTVNPEAGRGYLKDLTGNRRYWPVSCGATWAKGQTIDRKALAAARDQLWAEAVVRYLAGVVWWLADASVEMAHAAATGARVQDGRWDDLIAEFVEDRTFVTVEDVRKGCIKKDAGAWTTADRDDVTSALVRLGWEYAQRRVNGKGKRGFFRPKLAEPVPANDPAPVVEITSRRRRARGEG